MLIAEDVPRENLELTEVGSVLEFGDTQRIHQARRESNRITFNSPYHVLKFDSKNNFQCIFMECDSEVDYCNMMTMVTNAYLDKHVPILRF